MPPQGEPFQTATVEVRADLNQLKQDLEGAKTQVEQAAAEMGKLGDSAEAASAKAATNIQGMALKIAGTVAVIIAAVDAFVQLYDKADDFFNGKGDFNLSESGNGPADRIRSLRKEIEELKKDVADRGIMSRVGDAAEFWLGIKSGRTKALEDIAEKQKKIDEDAVVERRNAAKEEIEKLAIQAMEGADRIEAQRALAIKNAKEKYKESSGDVIAAINDKYDAELRKWEEVQKKKQDRELEDIRERRTAYDNLIREQEAKRIASEERIAARTRELTTRMLQDIAQQYNQLFDIRQMTMTLEAVNANLKALVNKRQGF